MQRNECCIIYKRLCLIIGAVIKSLPFERTTYLFTHRFVNYCYLIFIYARYFRVQFSCAIKELSVHKKSHNPSLKPLPLPFIRVKRFLTRIRCRARREKPLFPIRDNARLAYPRTILFVRRCGRCDKFTNVMSYYVAYITRLL